jgi:hypothetical protein
MTHDEIIHAARERIAEIGNDRAHADEKGRLLDIVHGPRCDACGQHECATKEWARRGGGVFNGMPCMMGSGSTTLSFTSAGWPPGRVD